MKLKKFWISIIILLIAGVGLYSFNRDQKNFEIAKNLEIYYSLFRELNMFYVDEVNPNKLVKTSIDGMLESLDPYTNFISEDQMEDFRFMTTGEYAGIGALIGKQNDKIVISEPYEGFPAQKFGLKAGDIILEVEGKSTAEMTTEDVSSLLKGPAKTGKNQIAASRRKDPFEVDVVREKFPLMRCHTMAWLTKNSIYPAFKFHGELQEDVKKAYLELKENPEALILMRSNPGDCCRNL